MRHKGIDDLLAAGGKPCRLTGADVVKLNTDVLMAGLF